MVDPATLSAASGVLQNVTGAIKSPSSSAAGRADSAAAMYGNFSTGDFSVGGGMLSGINTNGLIFAGIGVLGIAVILYFWKRHR